MAIDIKNVSKSFITKDKDFMALKDVNLHVDDGELICLLGPSGCGKTTLLRMVAGLETPDCGEIYDRGELVEGPSKERGLIYPESIVKRKILLLLKDIWKELDWLTLNTVILMSFQVV